MRYSKRWQVAEQVQWLSIIYYRFLCVNPSLVIGSAAGGNYFGGETAQTKLYRQYGLTNAFFSLEFHRHHCVRFIPFV
ncbi:MAG: hypothetical protein LBT46_12940 [Planctomycetaceae bacterium]|nr:hypothetical protein [Planctomycetaceae bacterium]